MSTSSRLPTPIIIYRISASVVGGYVFIWGFIAMSLASFYALGMEFHDAEQLAAIIGFLLYLVVFLWAFAAPLLVRVWLVLVGGGLLMTAAGSLIQHFLI